MSLNICAHCTSRFSIGAEHCPQCGNADYYEERSMAKVLRARGKLGPYGPPYVAEFEKVPEEVDVAAVRVWAAANGIEVGTRGRIPVAVIQRYRESHGEDQ